MADRRRAIPQVDRLVSELETDGLPRAVVVDAVRTVLAGVRHSGTVPGHDALLGLAQAELDARRGRRLRPVINATGVVLHTNLGRAPLSPAAIAAIVEAASGYTNLEFDVATGRRGDRYAHVEPLVALAAGAQAALVVNNNAAAVLLVCAALAAGREVVVSRGELIEIGGGFRIPEVLAESGATLREVGTTNRTHLRDFERAIGRDTALVLKVHPSNYRVVGFTTAVETAELATLARSRRVPLVYDVGSGLLSGELAGEPSVARALREGADLVCFSGDKLLGGPQAGIVCGRASLVAKLRKHPLLRAVRPDKLTLAALGATIVAYLDGAQDDLPVWRMLRADAGELRERCVRLAGSLRQAGYRADVVESAAVAGGGAMPEHELPSPAVRVRGVAAAALREQDPPVIARTESHALLLDLRTVPAAFDDVLAQSFPSISS